MSNVRIMTTDDVESARGVVTAAFDAIKPTFPGPGAGNPPPTQWTLAATAATTPEGAFVLEAAGEIVGVGIVRVLGRVGVIGPIAVAPQHWRQRHGETLTRACVSYARDQSCTTVGLATFANSIGHLALYGRLGFLPAGVTVSMCRAVEEEDVSEVLTGRMLMGSQIRRWSQLDAAAREQARRSVAVIGASYLPGFDPTAECDIATEHNLGDTLLLYQGDDVLGFATCGGGRTAPDAGQGMWVRTLAVQPGDQALACAERLVHACESVAREWREPRIGFPVDPRDTAVWDWLQGDGYRPEEILSRMLHGTPFSVTAGICWADWR